MMNERIKELEKQCWNHQAWQMDAEKFAELIVRECSAYLNGAMEVHNQQEQDLMDLAARKIKEYFGVE